MKNNPSIAKSTPSYSDLMKRMASNWHLPPEQLEGKLREFRRLFDEVEASRFAIAVDQIIYNGARDGEPLSFFPSLAEFKLYLPRQQLEREPNCPDCGGTGWVLLKEPGSRNQSARRCQRDGCLRVRASTSQR